MREDVEDERNEIVRGERGRSLTQPDFRHQPVERRTDRGRIELVTSFTLDPPRICALLALLDQGPVPKWQGYLPSWTAPHF